MADGTLKDASEIAWFHDKDDTTVNALAHGSKNLFAEREDENSQPLPLKSCRKQRPAPQKKQSTNASDTATAAISPGASAGTLPPDAEDDTEDTDFVYADSDEGPDPPALLTCSDSDDKEDNDNNDNNEDFFNISPEETADILPSKSLPDASVKVNARLRQATISASKPRSRPAILTQHSPLISEPGRLRTLTSRSPLPQLPQLRLSR
ncbi:hypothetical protein HGRIS_011204 [Hohenbuehelia grisea]|uniref:Uncharacterized protein n=1 Tax=Hohenbuehelia grisea TaxID=104357 RepID=A0ABR3JUD2_9AGAR